MPKVGDTRKDRAYELLRRLKRGPEGMVDSERVLKDEFTREAYERWFNSWVRRELIDLIPELRKAEKAKAEKAAEQQEKE